MKFKKMKHESFTSLPKFLNPELAVGDISKFKEPRIIQDWLLWLEQLPNESGRTTVLIRPWGRPDLIPQELTPFPINVKSRIHGYGGAPISIANSGKELILVLLNDCDRCLWIQSWEGLNIDPKDFNPKLKKTRNSFCLTANEENLIFADGLIDLQRNRWLGVMENGNKDFVVSFELDKQFQKPEILYEAKDFLGYLSMNDIGNKLAWVEWQKPHMPWDSSYLKIGLLDKLGNISENSILNVNLIEDKTIYSVFQPTWRSSDELLIIADNNGWWNLLKISIDLDTDEKLSWKRILDQNSEFALPQWISGMSTICVNQENIIFLRCLQGIWKMSILNDDGRMKDISIPFDDISYLNNANDRVVAIGSNSFYESGLVEVDLENDCYYYQSSREDIFNPKDISIAESFWFRGFNGERTHSWYYPPLNLSNTRSPLLVKIHSGPTAMAGKGLDLEVQFWTSRGWGVLEVNYGGSTGFGRDYRDRLKNKWGQVDVFDCCAAARALVEIGKADKNLIAIIGSSAGGFTALSCLYSSDIFSVAACKFPVTDLLDMSINTHRFEEGYLDYLIGNFSSNKELYFQRSPINNTNKINCPVIFFQGLKDKVVSPKQTKKMFLSLKEKQLPVEIYTFDNEGHGFINVSTKIKVLTETERFFRHHLEL